MTCSQCNKVSVEEPHPGLFGPLCLACASPPPPREDGEEEDDFIYLEVEVTRESKSSVIIRCRREDTDKIETSHLREAVEGQLNDYDWDDDPFSIEEFSRGEVSEDEALFRGGHYDFKP